MIRIVTDTSSDITRRQAAEMGITLLALPVSFAGTPYDQLGDEDFSQFYDLLAQSEVLPVTSQSSPGDYLEIFEAAKAAGDSVVVLPISSRLSSSFQSAHIAREMAGYADIHIVDAKQAILGLRLLVEYAVRLRERGESAAEIAARVTEASGRVRLFGALDTLEYLIKGGRISKSVGFVGSALGIKPLVTLRDGVVGMAGKARGQAAAAKLLLQFVREDMDFDPAFPFCFGYARDREPADAFARLAAEELPIHSSVVYPVGGVVGTHVGPNVIVVTWVVRG